MDTAYDEISTTLANYFDGFYEGDIEALKSIFHPACHLYASTDGLLQDDPMEAVYARVAGHEAPAKSSQKRQDCILSIDKSGAESALARVHIAIGPKLFTDYLSLLKLDGRWQIISKTYTYIPIAVEVEDGVAAAAE